MCCWMDVFVLKEKSLQKGMFWNFVCCLQLQSLKASKKHENSMLFKNVIKVELWNGFTVESETKSD